MSLIAPTPPAILAPPYRPLSVRFNGVNASMSRDGDLTGNQDGTDGTISLWVDFKGKDGSRLGLWWTTGDRFALSRRETDNRLRLYIFNGSTFDMELLTTPGYTSSSGWLHILASWTANNAWLYVNDVAPALSVNFRDADPADYTRTQHYFGRTSLGGSFLDAEVADFWLSTTQYWDLSVEANRRLFISEAGKPVDLGANGSNPGVTPIAFHGGPDATVEDWHLNRGTGAGQTLQGELTEGASSPSD